MRKVFLGFYFMLLLLLMSSCRSDALIRLPTNTQEIETDSYRSATPIETKYQNATDAQTATPKPTFTLHPSTTPTNIPPEARFTVNCWRMLLDIPLDTSATGVVVLRQSNSDNLADVFLRDLATGESIQINLPQEVVGTVFTTPNRELIAFSSLYFDTNGMVSTHEFVVMDARGNRLKTIPYESDWQTPFGWADNEHLIFSLRNTNPDVIAVRKAGSILLVNPFNGERRILPQDYAGFLSSELSILPIWDSGIGVSYDPSLSFVVYPHMDEDDPERYTYGLWDLHNQKFVASFEHIFNQYLSFNQYPPPRWSSDGSQFVFLGEVAHLDHPPQYELFRVDRKGQVEQLTQLGELVYIWNTGYNWSPDSLRIALFLDGLVGNWSGEARVALLDTTNLAVTDTCIQVGLDYHGLPTTPIWSPDSRHLLLHDWLGTGVRQVILLDIEKGYAAKLAEGKEAEAWMVRGN